MRRVWLLTRYEGGKKIKRIKWGRSLQGAGLRPVGESLHTGKSSPGEAGTLKICTRFFPEGKALIREPAQNHRRGSGAFSLPESLTEDVRPGEGAPRPVGGAQ